MSFDGVRAYAYPGRPEFHSGVDGLDQCRGGAGLSRGDHLGAVVQCWGGSHLSAEIHSQGARAISGVIPLSTGGWCSTSEVGRDARRSILEFVTKN